MNGFSITYGRLKERVSSGQIARGVSRQQVMNFASALNGWMKRLGVTDAAIIGDEMTSSFDSHFLQHQDGLLETLSRRTARDQAEYLLTWRRHFDEYRQIDTLPNDFKTALNALFEATGMSKADLRAA